ncbi:organic cation transporter protein-like [Ptychodera flava]|uniref:organic cation transporter protein-like n=1 Tax=Ptychodera flava TaxID=63121 RepID=UPI00396A6C0D
MELDEALALLGDYGLYQNLIFWLVSIPGAFFGAWHIMAIVFLATWPDTHHCVVPEGSYINETIPVTDWDDNGEPIYDDCYMYVNSSVDNTTTGCTEGWYYESSETIVTEWDLVCDQAALSQISSSIYMIGVLVGSFIAGHFADNFGRKTTFLACMWIQGVIGILVAFSQHFATFCVLRFFVGFFQQGVMLSQFILATEFFTPSKRVYAGFLNCMCWALGIMILSPIAYVFTHWRAFQIAISAPALLTFYYYWVIPESLRWLISKGRVKDAEIILYKAAKVNKVTLPDNVLTVEAKSDDGEQDDIHQNSKENGTVHSDSALRDNAVPSSHGTPNDTQHTDLNNDASAESTVKVLSVENEGDPSYNYLDLLKTGRMALYTTVMSFAWFVSSLVYYGLSYNTSNFQGSVHALFFLTGCVEIPAYALSMLFIVWWGRRWPTCIFLLLSGVSCGSAIFIPDGDDLFVLRIIILLIGKFGVTGAFGTIYVWSPELYPTLLRNMGLAVFAFFASLGGILAPLTVYATFYSVTVPMVVFGILSLVSGFCVLLLPETKDKIMPRTLAQAEQLGMSSKEAGKLDATAQTENEAP